MSFFLGGKHQIFINVSLQNQFVKRKTVVVKHLLSSTLKNLECL